MLKPGDAFERYSIEAAIGQGGMGAVYRAHDARLDRRVALKILSDEAPRSDDADARLLREARAAAALDHPNVVSIFDVGEVQGSPYVVMELVSGRTLREVIGGATPAGTRLGWLADVARALAAAHKKGLVHRDVKPENVMVRDDGVVKVLDFGIARRAASTPVDGNAPTQAPALPTLTKEGVRVGTPAYMAPEQIRGDALDGRSDQFAWGVLAYEVFTGRPPWRGDDPLSVVASILTDDVPGEALAAAGAPPAVAAAILRALSKKPADRFASMDDLLRAVEAPPAGEPAAVAPRGATSRATAPERYSTREVHEILARAVEQQEAMKPDARLGFDDLVAAAREVGVSPEALREASRDLAGRATPPRAPASALASQDPDAPDRDAWIRRRRRKFYGHLGVWMIVGMAVLVDGIMSGHFGDGPNIMLLWGVGVAIYGLRALMAGEDEWREERDKKDRQSRKKRRREEVVNRAIDEGAAVLLRTGAMLRQRIAATPQPGAPPPRARVATPVSQAPPEPDASAIAEQEAADAARAETGRKRRA